MKRTWKARKFLAYNPLNEEYTTASVYTYSVAHGANFLQPFLKDRNRFVMGSPPWFLSFSDVTTFLAINLCYGDTNTTTTTSIPTAAVAASAR